VVKDRSLQDAPIGCVGLGPLHGLPSSEGVGEIRDLIVEEPYRGRGLGSKLLHLCINDAKQLGYKQLYLETTQNMTSAQRLFVRTGFRPVTGQAWQTPANPEEMPCYFLMETL
jgi:putative acetyltransferase